MCVCDLVSSWQDVFWCVCFVVFCCVHFVTCLNVGARANAIACQSLEKCRMDLFYSQEAQARQVKEEGRRDWEAYQLVGILQSQLPINLGG